MIRRRTGDGPFVAIGEGRSMGDEGSAPRWARGHFVALEYHRGLLDDPWRMDAFDRALRALVRPGDVVLDLGCGTGVLALLAARRGAARVHAVESTPVAGLATALARRNGLADRVHVHRADALSLSPVEPVDLIVSDFLGRFVVDDGMLPVVAAAGRWLAPGGRFCPSRVVLRLAPVADVRLRAIDLFHEPYRGFDLTPALPYALNYAYHAQLAPEAVLAPPVDYHTLTLPFPDGAPPRFDCRCVFRAARAGLLRGLAGWFEATLAPDVVLDTGPGHETHWGQYLFPLPPTPVAAGDTIDARLWLEEGPDDLVWRWEGAVFEGEDGGPRVRFALSTQQRLGERDEDLAPRGEP